MVRPEERRLVTMTGLGGKGLGEYRAYLAQKQMFRSTEKEMCSKMQIPHNLHYVVFIVFQKPYLYINDVLPPGDTVQKYQNPLPLSSLYQKLICMSMLQFDFFRQKK